MEKFTTLYTKQGRLLPCFCFDRLPSTNDMAKKLLKEGAGESFSVTAREQTSGRGRMSRSFFSPRDEGLYLSFCTEAKGDFLRFGALSALAVHALAEEYFKLDVRFKWPNDVVSEGKKLCGILSEGVLSGGRLEGMVIGTGVNVGQKTMPDVGQPATSLYMLGVQADKQALLQDIMNYFWQDYPAVEERGFAAICEPYRERFPFLGKEITVKNGEKPLFGTVRDVSSRGTLLLSTADGPEEIYIGDLIV